MVVTSTPRPPRPPQPRWPTRDADPGGAALIPSFANDLLTGTTSAGVTFTLRDLVDGDVGRIVEAGNDGVVQTWLPLPRPYERGHAEWFVAAFAPGQLRSGAGIVRAIDVAGALAGVINLKRTHWSARTTEIGYWMGPDHRGSGIASAAAKLLSEWAIHDQGMVRVEALVAPGNVASLATVERAGFVREGVLRSAGHTHAGQVDLVVLSLIDTDLG